MNVNTFSTIYLIMIDKIYLNVPTKAIKILIFARNAQPQSQSLSECELAVEWSRTSVASIRSGC